MDVFALRDKVVSDYRRYIESFVRIRDSRIDSYVHQEFGSGVLWPESILQSASRRSKQTPKPSATWV